MTFEPAGNLFKPILDFYDRVIEHYRTVQALTPDRRVELLLSFLVDHVARLRRQVAEWRQTGDEGALDAWFQYSPDREPLYDLPELDLDAEVSIDEVIEVTTRLMDRLIDFCADASERAQSVKAEGLFEHLREQARQEKRRLARVSQEIKEL